MHVLSTAFTAPACHAMIAQAGSPRDRFYWGYIWDGTGSRVTQPIRNTANKSHMPAEQVGLQQLPAAAAEVDISCCHGLRG